MLGFWGCCADAGALAIAVMVHSTIGAIQFTLNLLIVASSVLAADAKGRSLRLLPLPTVFAPDEPTLPTIGEATGKHNMRSLWHTVTLCHNIFTRPRGALS